MFSEFVFSFFLCLFIYCLTAQKFLFYVIYYFFSYCFQILNRCWETASFLKKCPGCFFIDFQLRELLDSAFVGKNLTWLCHLILSAGVQELESRFLVPGDLLVLTGNKVQMPCDAILIDGSCVADEGMLTGTVLSHNLQPLQTLPASSSIWTTTAKHGLLWDLPTPISLTKLSCSGWFWGFKWKLLSLR